MPIVALLPRRNATAVDANDWSIIFTEEVRQLFMGHRLFLSEV
jgi:hypothetical protein